MELTFTSSSGRFSMDGGNGNHDIKILNIDGLGLITKTANTVTYPFSPGQTTLSREAGARVITVSADILRKGQSGRDVIRNMIAAGENNGTLFIERDGRKLSIECHINTITGGEARANEYPGLVIQFTCDYPYFKGEQEIVQLYSVTKNIKAGFNFPFKFSERASKEIPVINRGEKTAEPIIYIGIGEKAQAGILETEPDVDTEETSSDKTITLFNERNSASIKFTVKDTANIKYDGLTIDIPKRRIYYSKGDLSSCIADGCFLSDFVLERGENKITTYVSEYGYDLDVIVAFSPEYYCI